MNKLLSTSTKAPLIIYQHDPLIWLVSALYTDKFHSTNRPSQFGSSPENTENFKAVENWVKSHIEANKFFNKARKSLELEYPESDYPLVEVIELIKFAEKKGVQIPLAVNEATEWLRRREEKLKLAEEWDSYDYPTIEREEIWFLSEEPLWPLYKAILYTECRTSTQSKSQILNYVMTRMNKLCEYVSSAYKIGKLKVHVPEEKIEHIRKQNQKINKELLELGEVEPAIFLEWVENMPIYLELFCTDEEMTEIVPKQAPKPNYITPDMQLMFDAINLFWNNYDLNNPNPHAAPLKKDVVAWLKQEAEARKIDFSKTRAEIMDTIIRCPKARGGGNTF